jgi:hypothetical protein
VGISLISQIPEQRDKGSFSTMAKVNARMNSKIKYLLSLAFTGGYTVNLEAFNSRNKSHTTYGGYP